MLEIKDLHASVNGKEILKGINLSIKKGEVHAIISNVGRDSYYIKEGDRIGQLVITPVILASFSTENIKERTDGAFGSTGR